MKTATLFKALSDPNRIRALNALRRKELCVCQIVELLGLAPSTVSKHMSILANAQLVESTKKGRWVYFRLVADQPTDAGRMLAVLPSLLEDELQLERDRRSLDDILTLDPEALCKIQNERSSEPNAVGVTA